jgi:hypothetical protein
MATGWRWRCRAARIPPRCWKRCCCSPSALPSSSPSARSPWSRASFCAPLSRSASTCASAASMDVLHTTRRRSSCSKTSPNTAAISAAASAAARCTRSRAVWDANVIAFGHTADDFCESLLRNIDVHRPAQRPAAGHVFAQRDFRLIRPLVFVSEDITRALRRVARGPVIPCGCSLRTGTVRRGIREAIARLGTGASASEREHSLRHGKHQSRAPARYPVSQAGW